MEDQIPFPERLRESTKAARLSQKALAEKVGVNFTYLSKIENGRVEPPRESVLQRITKELAGELGMDEIELSDELITLAGTIPSDLAETLSRNPEVIPIFSAPVTPTSPSRPPSAPRSTRTPGPRCTAPHRGRSRARSRGG